MASRLDEWRIKWRDEWATYSFSGLVVQWAGDVDGARHVLDGESAAQITAGYLVANLGGCVHKTKQLKYIQEASINEKDGVADLHSSRSLAVTVRTVCWMSSFSSTSAS